MDDSDGWMGRRLWKEFQTSRLFDGIVTVWTYTETEFLPGRNGYDRMQDSKPLVEKGIISEMDYNRVLGDLSELHEKGTYFYTLSSFIYKGWKNRKGVVINEAHDVL